MRHLNQTDRLRIRTPAKCGRCNACFALSLEKWELQSLRSLGSPAFAPTGEIFHLCTTCSSRLSSSNNPNLQKESEP